MTQRNKGWMQTAGAVLTLLLIIGFGWKVAEGWFSLLARVQRLEDRDSFVHGEYVLPRKGQ